jgi:hypothetical protein
MMRKNNVIVAMMLVMWTMASCVDDGPVREAAMTAGFDVESGSVQVTSPASCHGRGLEMVRLKGKVRHFGYDILQNPPAPKPLTGIADVHVWLAEYPFSRNLNIRTDEDGMWELVVIKRRGTTLPISMMYEKDHYPPEVEAMVFSTALPASWDKSLIRSNIHEVTSEDIEDFAMQMPDELFLFYAKSTLENGISQMAGVPYTIENLAVATVGKSWASIYNPTLPHGDPGASVSIETASTPLSGPIYFDETVTPNPTVTATSVDGGVLFNNLLPGTHQLNAVKEPFSYDPVTFTVDETVRLYVASPPHSIQGTNPSGPGEN